MIYESCPWKRDLLRRRSIIIKNNTNEEYSKDCDKVYTSVEKGVFYSAFIIRKLIDSKGKLSEEAERYTFQVGEIKPLKQVDSFHRYPDIDTHDWEKEKIRTVQGKEICNWLIHSYIFCMVGLEKPFSFFYVSSDYDRNKSLYKISMEDWLDYMKFIATDYVVAINSHYDEEKKDYVYTKKERE